MFKTWPFDNEQQKLILLSWRSQECFTETGIFIIENFSFFGASVAVFLSWARQRIIAEGDLNIRLYDFLGIS